MKHSLRTFKAHKIGYLELDAFNALISFAYQYLSAVRTSPDSYSLPYRLFKQCDLSSYFNLKQKYFYDTFQ